MLGLMHRFDASYLSSTIINIEITCIITMCTLCSVSKMKNNFRIYSASMRI